jgi:hypothetical protein
VSRRIGPSMSTEPGWMAPQGERSYYFELVAGEAACAPHGVQNDPSMLLSFERPAPAGPRTPCGARVEASVKRRSHQARDRPALHASPRSLKTAQKPHQPPSISGG